MQYDGGPFAGWAQQPGQRTVAAEVVKALEIVLRQPVDLAVAGRTDRGVHALGQVISYDGPLPRLRSVNAVLPHEIVGPARPRRPRRASPPATTPSARTLRLPRAGAPPRRRRSSAAARCGGRTASTRTRSTRARRRSSAAHDFTAFTPTETYHTRFIRARLLAPSWARHGDMLEFHIEADSFMRNMNRILVGTMLEVAARPPRRLRALLEGAPAHATRATPPPPTACTSTAVRYDA